MKWLELRIPPPLVTLIFGGAMYGAARAFPRLTYEFPGRVFAFIVFAAAGIALSIAGVALFRQQRTTVNPLQPDGASAIVSSGVYSFTRNPMYLGMLLLLIGWGVYLTNAAAAVLLPLFMAYLTRFQIKPEERALLAKFGGPFADYMSRVRRWI
jgi:protein-S-isoprenylcysteine O-methyltransferase Ste14